MDRHSLLSEMNLSEDGTPMTSPRLPRSFNTTPPTGEQYVLLYANNEILPDKTQCPLNIQDGYFHLASVNLESLHRLANQIYNKILGPLNTETKFRWSDLVKSDAKPVLSQGDVAFYKGKSHNANKLDLEEYMIMVSPEYLFCRIVFLIPAQW